MIRIYKLKFNIKEYCSKKLKEAELDAEKRSIELIRSYNSFKKHTLADLDKQEDKMLQLDVF